MALNIIHPYTYRLEAGRIKVSEKSLCPERDSKIGDLVRICLEKNVTVVRHDMISSGLEKSMVDIALKEVSYLQNLYNPEVLAVVTDNLGLPFLDEKPDYVSDEDYDAFAEIFTPGSRLKELVSGQNSLFIGGFLERCVTNFTVYCAEFYRNQGEKWFYVPELCVSIDAFERACAEDKLKRNGVMPLSYEEAIKFVEEQRA